MPVIAVNQKTVEAGGSVQRSLAARSRNELKSSSRVLIRSEELIIPTYLPALPDKNPMFLEKRAYQGSSGKVYPLPFTDRIAEKPVERKWKALWIENDFLRVLVLPEIGGRIHAIHDKTNGYDLIYNQPVIKPALVGLAGPWISGGIEFNWPQHHRPATFLPADFEIEEHADGSKTIWCSAVTAHAHCGAALTAPQNLGEAKHLLANQGDIHYWLGCVLSELGEAEQAREHWLAAATFRGDFQEMSVRAFSELTYYSALSWDKLGQRAKARKLFRELLAYAQKHQHSPAQIDYFATSLPTMLLFDDDLQFRQETTALFLPAQARLGLGETSKARSLLKAVLEREPSHALAQDLISENQEL